MMGFKWGLWVITALSHSEAITLAPVGVSATNRRQPKSMELILMTRQELLNAALQPLLLDGGRNEERWTPPPCAASDRRTGVGASVEWPRPPLSNHRPLILALHLGLGAMTGPSIISANWSLLIAIAVNYLDFAEIAHWMGRRPKEHRHGRSE